MNPPTNKGRTVKPWQRKAKRNKEIIKNYKLVHPCVVCGEDRMACLDFHHTGDDKIDTIANLANKHVSMKRLENEMGKCIVICSNCHRIIHSR